MTFLYIHRLIPSVLTPLHIVSGNMPYVLNLIRHEDDMISFQHHFSACKFLTSIFLTISIHESSISNSRRTALSIFPSKRFYPDCIILWSHLLFGSWSSGFWFLLVDWLGLGASQPNGYIAKETASTRPPLWSYPRWPGITTYIRLYTYGLECISFCFQSFPRKLV